MEGCGSPIAPPDGSTVGSWYYDEGAATPTVRLDGLGLHLGVPKAVNGAELASPAEAPDFVRYNVVELIGGVLTVRIDSGNGDVWWEFELVKEE